MTYDRQLVAARKFRGLDWALDQRTGSSSANHILILMGRRANKSLTFYGSHERLTDESGYSLSTVGRAIKHLRREGYIREVPSAPKLRARGIRTYRLVVGRPSTEQIDRLDPSQGPVATGQGDRQNQEESKRKQLGSQLGARRCSKRKEAVRIGDLVIRVTTD